jgi:hypothetical protein
MEENASISNAGGQHQDRRSHHYSEIKDVIYQQDKLAYIARLMNSS